VIVSNIPANEQRLAGQTVIVHIIKYILSVALDSSLLSLCVE